MLWLAACGEDQPAASLPEQPQHAPPQLHPMQNELELLAASLPSPTDAQKRELDELTEISLGIVATDERTKGRIQRALLNHELAWIPLERALSHEDTAVRSRAAWLCGQTKNSILQLPLLMRLKYELDPEAILWAADALFRLGNDAGLSFLEGGMTRTETAQRAGILAIDVCKTVGIELADQPTYDQLREHMRDLTARWLQTGKASCPEATAPDNEQLRARVARRLAVTAGTQLRPIDDSRFVLTRSGQLPIEHLTPALAAAEPYLRTMVLQVLTDIGTPAKAAGPAILPLLGDPLTKAYAVRALSRIGFQQATQQLRPLLHSVDVELRAAATGALGMLGDEASRAKLIEMLGDDTEAMDVRVQAAFSLSLLGDDAGQGRHFLDERKAKGDYHPQMLAQLFEELAARAN